MEIWIPVVVGFGSVLLGVVGGHLGTVRIERQRTRRQRAGILRALVGELHVNSFEAVAIVYSQGHVGRMAAETWRSANLELAQFIPDRLYRRLLALYSQVPVLESVALHARQGGQVVVGSLRHIVDRWIEDNDSLLQDLVQCPEAEGLREQYQGKMSGSAMRSLLEQHGTGFIEPFMNMIRDAERMAGEQAREST